MLQLAQVSFGRNYSTSIGWFYLIFAIIYLFLMIGWLALRRNTLTTSAWLIYILQGVLVPVISLISGIILLIQGWRLDPAIQFQQLLLFLLIVYLSFRDNIINFILRIK
ncbi:Ycf66 family protein (plasmid) [Nostoc sp. NIES-2111]|nr:Ycf66 family protein [Nostoc sp. NIES-2111]